MLNEFCIQSNFVVKLWVWFVYEVFLTHLTCVFARSSTAGDSEKSGEFFTAKRVASHVPKVVNSQSPLLEVLEARVTRCRSNDRVRASLY